jgi:hypothetical protein
MLSEVDAMGTHCSSYEAMRPACLMKLKDRPGVAGNEDARSVKRLWVMFAERGGFVTEVLSDGKDRRQTVTRHRSVNDRAADEIEHSARLEIGTWGSISCARKLRQS